jgi:uncharacterized membrane protein
MNRGTINSIAALCICIMACIAFAEGETATWQRIPNANSANDMSSDGRWIVGNDNTGTAYLWDSHNDILKQLPADGFEAVAVSDNGQVVLGSKADSRTGAEVAAIWTGGSQSWTSIGYLPNANQCPSLSNGYELSADGTVAVGLSWDGCSGRGFRWTQATGMVELESLANGGNRASVISADGNVIGGFAQGSFSRTPAIWDGAGNGTLLDPPGGDALGEVHGISDDGSIILGNWNGDATMWIYPALTQTIIGAGSVLTGWEGIPMDIADNDTIVGFDIISTTRRAWIQPGGAGALNNLRDWVVAHGGTIPTGTILEVAQAISADGTKVIGHTSGLGAWIVIITPRQAFCTGDLVSSATFQPPPDGQVDGADLAYLLGDWGANPGSVADIVTSATFAPPPDGVVNGADLAVLLGAWGDCE